MELKQQQILRYSRHLILPEVGVEGQERLLRSSVLLIGAGGLGSPLSLYLAAAGVGRIGIVDFDAVEFSNLQRQIIHSTGDVGRSKVDSAKERIVAINPDVKVDTYECQLTSDNIMEIIRDYDVVVDGTDNFPTRYLTNDACVLAGKPNIYGSIFRFEGQCTVFYPGKGPCYRCLYPSPPPPGEVPSCAEGGVLGVLPGVIGTLQATEAIKLLLGKGEPLIGRLLLYNALEMRFRELRLHRDPNCPVCGEHPTITELIDYFEFCGVGRGLEQPAETSEFDIEPGELQEWRERGKQLVLLDVREPEEWAINHIDGAKLIPLGTLPERVHELDTADEIVVYCHFGQRSLQACQFLHRMGFRKLRNLAGGIDAWSLEVDPSVPRY